MPRKFWSCFTPLGGWIASIACTLLLWGLIPSLLSMYPRYSISSVQNVNFWHWLLSPHCNVAWVPHLIFLDGLQGYFWRCREGHLSKLVHTLWIPSALMVSLGNVWRTCNAHRLLLVGMFSPRKDNGTDFRCIWIQSNGVVTHVEIKVCCKRESF